MDESKRNDFSIPAGGDRLLVITVSEQDGNLMNLTGCLIKWALCTAPPKLASVVTKESTTGAIRIADQTSARGQFTVQLDGADTKTLPAGTYYHEARVTDSDGNSDIVVDGLVTLFGSPTAE